ncbi:MAG: tRNA cyclic N6-threonylcarbamoyladenosine(37) synthase TcdA [Verrucomicrobia bacterium]|nr:tRNA cyclic N6-threonylcarbamoyladenosine(37) synthase TcdA [Verrucomicrobiota bacterium]
MSDYDQRFGGIARLYGAEGLRRLCAAHVCVVGIGGVGTWTVEALARSGIGALTLVDLDEVCVTNVNRQLHALDDTIGRPKVELMAERVRAINPECRVTARAEFFTAANAEEILAAGFSFVVDAIDGVSNKARLLALCHAKKIPVITCGAAGGRRDGTAVRVADIAHASHDRLLAAVRACLRAEHGFARGGKNFGITAVFSPEPPVFPQKDGTVCTARESADLEDRARINCDWGYGSAAFVTGAFGFAAAGVVVRRIAEG